MYINPKIKSSQLGTSILSLGEDYCGVGINKSPRKKG
jgi:hypothetical protein